MESPEPGLEKPAFDSETVINFWFNESSSKDWFEGGQEFDLVISERFSNLPDIILHSEDDIWRQNPEAALAAVIVLDQFTRNMYRGDAKSFAYDAKALEISRYAIKEGWDRELPENQRAFLYMPFMHSEDLAVHEEGAPLFQSLENKNTLEYEQKHVRILEMFGRYPHRNNILGRQTTAEEKDFLENDPDSSF